MGYLVDSLVHGPFTNNAFVRDQRSILWRPVASLKGVSFARWRLPHPALRNAQAIRNGLVTLPARWTSLESSSLGQGLQRCLEEVLPLPLRRDISHSCLPCPELVCKDEQC